jgi:prevent-host-death family protein
MESFGIEEARNQLGDLIDRVRIGGEHITLTRYGKAVAVLVPVEWHPATAPAPAPLERNAS